MARESIDAYQSGCCTKSQAAATVLAKRRTSRETVMRNQLSKEDAHGIFKGLHDAYVNDERVVTHSDLTITIEHEHDGRTETVSGFVAEFDNDTVTLRSAPDLKDQLVPLTGIVRVCVAR